MPTAPRILIVEDEPAIADTLVYALRTEGLAPAWCTTGGEALSRLAREDFALVVLDVGLPDLNGFDVCRQLRARSTVPVLFLTARSAEVDRVVGLELGGDDYVSKPFSPREVAARVRAILRRARPAPELPAGAATGAAVAAPAWEVDEERCQVRHHGRPLDLTRNEYRLVRTLHSRPGKVFTRDELMQLAWDDPGASFDRTVDAHVKSVRAKMRTEDPTADPIVTHRGLGYSWSEDL